VVVRNRHIPDPWYAETEVPLRVFVVNRGRGPSPAFALRGRIGGGELVRIRIDEGAIAAGDNQGYSIVLLAPNPGNRTLLVEARLLGGQEDANPGDNTFSTEVQITIAPSDSSED
jgi:hypothetical protein